MKKYISILLVAVLSASLLAGCGGGSGNSGQQPAADAKEEAAQPEANEAAEPAAGRPRQTPLRTRMPLKRKTLPRHNRKPMLKAMTQMQVPQQDFIRSMSLTQRLWILLKAPGCSSVPTLPA